jgi:hypothetical protein
VREIGKPDLNGHTHRRNGDMRGIKIDLLEVGVEESGSRVDNRSSSGGETYVFSSHHQNYGAPVCRRIASRISDTVRIDFGAFTFATD